MRKLMTLAVLALVFATGVSAQTAEEWKNYSAAGTDEVVLAAGGEFCVQWGCIGSISATTKIVVKNGAPLAISQLEFLVGRKVTYIVAGKERGRGEGHELKMDELVLYIHPRESVARR